MNTKNWTSNSGEYSNARKNKINVKTVEKFDEKNDRQLRFLIYNRKIKI